jgi:hypothetical protein
LDCTKREEKEKIAARARDDAIGADDERTEKEAMSKVPYAEMLGGRDTAKVIAETPVRLGLILDGLSTAEIEARPAPGKWCVREIVAHLADCEIVWGWRLRQALGEEHAVIQPFEQDAWAVAWGAMWRKSLIAMWRKDSRRKDQPC